MNRQKEFRAALHDLASDTHGLIDLVKKQGHHHDAAEIAQQVACKLLKKAQSDNIPVIKNFKAYVSKAIRHQAIDLSIQRQRRSTVVADDVQIDAQLECIVAAPCEHQQDPLHRVQREEERQILQSSVPRLPSLEQEVIQRLLDEMSQAEVARQLNLTVDVVRGLTERALKKLREMMERRRPRAPGSDSHGK